MLAAWSSNAPAPQFWRHPQVLDYVLHTALGYDVRHLLPGAYAANPMPARRNGSLDMLSYELRLYVAVALAGVCGGLARRFTVLALCAAGAALALAWPQWPDLVFAGNPGARMGTLVAHVRARGTRLRVA